MRLGLKNSTLPHSFAKFWMRSFSFSVAKTVWGSQTLNDTNTKRLEVVV